jgi:hypothetical protein
MSWKRWKINPTRSMAKGAFRWQLFDSGRPWQSKSPKSCQNQPKLIGLPSRDQHDDKLDDRDKGENRFCEAQHNGNDDHPKQPHHKAFLRFALSGFIEGNSPSAFELLIVETPF